MAAPITRWTSLDRAASRAAAHVLLFKLHLPSRYTEQSLSIVLNLAGGIAAALLIERLLQTRAFALRATAISILAAALLLYPVARWAEGKFPHANLKTADVPELYEFFAQQPKDIVIASLSPQADFIPSFSHRTVLVAREYAIPYHLGYYRQFSRRVRELIRAQYTPDLEEVRGFVQRYGVAYVLLDANGLGADYLKQHAWINQYQPEAVEALNALERGARPAISDLVGRCSVLRTDSVIVLSTECVLRR